MPNAWDFLDEYRNKEFKGDWPAIPQMFLINEKRFPFRTCFSAFSPQERHYEYAETGKTIRKLAAFLQEKGVKKKVKVALSGKNSPEWAIVYLAVLFAGGTIVPLDYQLHTKDILNLMRQADASLLFIDKEKYQEAKDQIKDSEELFSLSPENPGFVFELSSTHDFILPEISEIDIAAILFTSGTTGHAKGVMLSHRNIVCDCYLAQQLINISEKDCFYALLPLHHSYTMLAVFMEAISVGAKVVFAERMVISQILKELRAGKVTILLGIPLLYNKLIKGIMAKLREKGALIYGLIRFLMKISGLIKKIFGKNPGKVLFKGILEKAALNNLRLCISGGGPLPASTFRMFNQLGLNFVQGYGLTETSPIVTLNPVEHYKEDSVGKVLPQTEVRILKPDSRGNGEIAIKGPMLMQGYYKNKQAFQEIMTDEGFLKTGDAGHLDRENYLYLTGRLKNLIVTEGGKNVYPEEIEEAFQLFDEIDQIMVSGYTEDEKLKREAIQAHIFPAEEFVEKIRTENKGDSDQLIRSQLEKIISQVNKQLMPYQQISRFHVLDSPMEMTSTKKIKRHKVD